MKKDKNNRTITSVEHQTVYPVIMAVAETVKDLTPKERVKFLSRQARRALEISAEKSRVRLGKLEQDERNAPLPFDGIYWSITHKTEYVGGVIAPYPVGIDIEKKTGKDRLMVRVGKASHKELVFKRGSREMNFTGKVMRGFLFVDPEGFDTEDDLDFWVEKALEFNARFS